MLLMTHYFHMFSAYKTQYKITVNETKINLTLLPKYMISTYQNLKPRVNKLCDARIHDVIFNFCVSFYFLFMEEKLYLASKLIHL